MQERLRIPIIDTLVDGCRMLPEAIQGFLFASVFVGGSYFVMIGFYYFLLTFIVVEILLIIILIQKNLVYRRISKIENAISNKILWIKTKQDSAKIIRYFIFSSMLFLIGLWVYSKVGSERYLVAISLLCVLYFLKGLFYVPLVIVRIIPNNQIQFINDFNGKCVEFDFYEIEKIEIQEKKISIFPKDKKVDFKVFFHRKGDRHRLRQFLKSFFPKIEIL